SVSHVDFIQTRRSRHPNMLNLSSPSLTPLTLEQSGHRSPYEPTVSKSTYLRSPALRYLHRFSVYSISRRRESTGVVTHRDLFCLWSMTEGRVSNLAYLFLTHMEQMSHKKRGAICGGTYITRLAWRLDIFCPDPQVLATCLQLPIDMTIMTRMGLVQ